MVLNCVSAGAVSKIPKVLNQSDCSIGIRALTSMFTASFTKQRIRISRALSLLLVAFILFGTTIEAAHRHGRVLGQAPPTSFQVTPEKPDGSLKTNTSCTDCLICQLHQQFTATLIPVRPDTTALNISVIRVRTDRVSVESHKYTPQSNRAPPQIN